MLEMTLLGQAMITRDNIPLRSFRSQKEAALLIYLAHTGQIHRRETMADLLWEASSTKQSLANLRTVLTRLRAQVGDALVVTRKTVAYADDLREDVDSVRFQRALGGLVSLQSAAEADQLRQGLALYGGEFLRGFYLTGAPRFNEWAVIEQEALRQQTFLGYGRLIDFALRTHAYPAGIDAARRLLALDPLNEAVHFQLMTLLAVDGQSPAALTQYGQLADLLEVELGVEPQPKTKELYRRVLRGEWEQGGLPASVDALTIHGLPPRPQPFVGRTAELAALDDLLRGEAHPLITLLGPGGIGKSSLAVEAVRRMTHTGRTELSLLWVGERFCDGIYFVSLVSRTTALALADAIARVVGLTFQHHGGDEETQLVAHLVNQSMLLVLDNFEQLSAGKELVSRLMAGAPAVQLLVTSRHVLGVPGETVITLDGLDLPTSTDERQFLHAAAVQLFLQSARRTHVTFDLHIDDLAHINRICRLVQGTPLAILLAATWVSMLAPAEIADEIARDSALLATQAPDLPVRHRSMQVIFDHSWLLLTSAQQRLLATLSIFRGGYTLAMAQAFTQTSMADLLGLVQRSLVVRAGPAGRFTTHELLRQLALTKLAELGIVEQTLHAQAVEMLETLFADELSPVYVALAHHAEQAGFVEKACGYLRAVGDAAGAHHQYALAVESYSRALALTPPQAIEDKFSLLLAREEGMHWLAHRDSQRRELTELTHLARLLETFDQAIAVLLRHARFAEATGDHAASARAAEEATQLADSTGAAPLIARSRLAWGVALGRQGHYAGAAQHLTIAVSAARAAGLADVESACLRNLGIDAAYQGDFSTARCYFEQDLALVQQQGNRENERQALGNLGVIARYLGDLPGARAYLENALLLFRQIDDRRGEAITLSNLGVVAAHAGDRVDAGVKFRRTLAISRQIGDTQSEGEALLHLGGLALDAGESRRAVSYYEEARAIALRKNLSAYVVEAQTGLAAATLAQGDLTLALALVREHVADINEVGLAAAEEPLRVYFNAYQVLHAGQDAAAAHILEKAVSLLQEQADRIVAPDARQAFLANVPVHQKIGAAAASTQHDGLDATRESS